MEVCVSNIRRRPKGSPPKRRPDDPDIRAGLVEQRRTITNLNRTARKQQVQVRLMVREMVRMFRSSADVIGATAGAIERAAKLRRTADEIERTDPISEAFFTLLKEVIPRATAELLPTQAEQQPRAQPGERGGRPCRAWDSPPDELPPFDADDDGFRFSEPAPSHPGDWNPDEE